MPVSRRSFVATLGAGAAGLFTAPLITWRGHEELLSQQGPGSSSRRADRLLATRPGMIRLVGVVLAAQEKELMSIWPA